MARCQAKFKILLRDVPCSKVAGRILFVRGVPGYCPSGTQEVCEALPGGFFDRYTEQRAMDAYRRFYRLPYQGFRLDLLSRSLFTTHLNYASAHFLGTRSKPISEKNSMLRSEEDDYLISYIRHFFRLVMTIFCKTDFC